MPLGVDLVDADPPHHARAQRRDGVGGSSGTQRPEGPASPPPAMEHRAAGHANGNANCADYFVSANCCARVRTHTQSWASHVNTRREERTRRESRARRTVRARVRERRRTADAATAETWVARNDFRGVIGTI